LVDIFVFCHILTVANYKALQYCKRWNELYHHHPLIYFDLAVC